MPYELFHNYCPDLAERETRAVTLAAPHDGLPADAYGMLEMYSVGQEQPIGNNFFLQGLPIHLESSKH